MIFIEFLKAIFYGIVEGITEWLPISSTGHLILTEEFINFNLSAQFMEFFRVIIQLGAIMAVVVIYWNKIWPFHRKRRELKINWKKPVDSGFFGWLQHFCNDYVYLDKIVLWLKIVVACIPTIIFSVFDDWFEQHFYNFPSVAVTLIVYGVAFIIAENYRNMGRIKTKTTSLTTLTYKTAFIIGLFQVLAIIPGTSRSGATILGAILIGCSREISAEFTFFLGIPTMFGASLLKGIKLIPAISFNPTNTLVLFTGIIVSFFVSVFAIKFLVGYIKKHDFKAFGYYRIVLGVIVLLYFFIKLIVS